MLRHLLPFTILLACGRLEPGKVGAAVPPAAAPPVLDAAAPPAPVAQPSVLRVHVIGASVSAGFEDGPLAGAREQGDSVTLQHVLGAWADGAARVTMHNPTKMTAMFSDPLRFGREQVQGAAKARPDVLVAIDFPFWFAYGHVGGEEAEARAERLAAGLAMLADLSMPVLLGDLPDMHGAAERMLRPQQIPGKELLGTLNAQLAAFVRARRNLHLVPLAAMVHTLKDEGVVLPLATGALRTAPGALLQEDRLHATRLGMAYLGHALQDGLRGAFPAGHPLRDRVWSFEQFVAAAGAEGDLEQVRAEAAKAGR